MCTAVSRHCAPWGARPALQHPESPARSRPITEQSGDPGPPAGAAVHLPRSRDGALTDRCARPHATGAPQGTPPGATGDRVRLPAALLCVLLKEAPASSEANPKVCVVPSDNKHVTVTLSPGLCKKCHLGKSSVSISKSLREVSLLWFPDPSIVTRSSLDIKNCPAHFLPGRGRWRPRGLGVALPLPRSAAPRLTSAWSPLAHG